MAEVAPSAGGGGGGNRNFLLIIAGLGALVVLGLLALGAIFLLPLIFPGPTNVAGVTSTPTRISIPPTPTRPGAATPTRVVNDSVPLAPGERRVILELEGSNNAILTTQEGGKAPLIQKGKWQYNASANEITVNLTDINGRPFEDQLVIRVLGSNFSVISYNKALHGDLSRLQLRRADGPTNFLVPVRGPGLAAPNMQATATPDPLQGDYSGIIPNVTGNQRIYTLGLTATGGTAVLSIVETGKPSILSLGTWQTAGNEITVDLDIKDGAPVQETLVFDLVGNDLVGKTYDQTVYGPNFVLTRDPASPILTSNPAAGIYNKVVSLETPVPLEETATPIAITATPVFITATPGPGANVTPDKGGQVQQQDQLPNSGLGEDLLLLFGGGILLLGVIFVVRRMRAS
jgi:hypothetical protein